MASISKMQAETPYDSTTNYIKKKTHQTTNYNKKKQRLLRQYIISNYSDHFLDAKSVFTGIVSRVLKIIFVNKIHA